MPCVSQPYKCETSLLTLSPTMECSYASGIALVMVSSAAAPSLQSGNSTCMSEQFEVANLQAAAVSFFAMTILIPSLLSNRNMLHFPSTTTLTFLQDVSSTPHITESTMNVVPSQLLMLIDLPLPLKTILHAWHLYMFAGSFSLLNVTTVSEPSG